MGNHFESLTNGIPSGDKRHLLNVPAVSVLSMWSSGARQVSSSPDVCAAAWQDADSDGHTGFANYRRIDRHLRNALAAYAARCEPIALIIVDVDCFKLSMTISAIQRETLAYVQSAASSAIMCGTRASLLAVSALRSSSSSCKALTPKPPNL